MNILGLFEIGITTTTTPGGNMPTTDYVQKRKSVNSLIMPLHTQTLPFDGEKSLGGMGSAINYIPEYYTLSTRSWQSYASNPLSKTIIEKWMNWIIDKGLKLNASPNKIVLKTEGIVMSKDDREQFNSVVEARWQVWANSKNSTFDNNQTFNEATRDIYLNSKISGDVLVILRYIKGVVKIQYIDGAKVQTPFDKKINQGPNIISNGVEVTQTGQIVGYHVNKGPNDYDFVEAYSKQVGLRTAFLVKGSKWRINYHRGLPVIATVLETLSKIDRYREASVGSAEEVAKIAYQIVHQNYSDGRNPFGDDLLTAFSNQSGTGDGEIPEDSDGEALAKLITATFQKQAINLPKGAKIENVNQSNTVEGFNDFYKPNAEIICACVGIPPNVALSLYNDSYSASRAATKDWDHTMGVDRNWFSAQYYTYVYKFWLYTEILKNKIQAPGYIRAFIEKDFMITESYETVRFTGPMFPHIDPVKEVKAARAKLGDKAKDAPLSTIEQETELLGMGDSDANIEQFSDEIAKLKENEIIDDEVIVDPVDD